MQNAYDSYQVTQLIGRFSLVPADAVHVKKVSLSKLPNPHCRFAVVGSMSVRVVPVDGVPPRLVSATCSTLFERPRPSFKYVCFPEPAAGK
jgi:hypothetical protein